MPQERPGDAGRFQLRPGEKRNATRPRYYSYTQEMEDADLLHSGEESSPYRTGQQIYDPQVSGGPGQKFITLKDGTRAFYDENAADQDAWKWGLAGMGLAALPVGAAIAAGAGAGGGAGAGAGAGELGGAAGGELAGGGSTFGQSGGGMWDDFFNFDPNVGGYDPNSFTDPLINGGTPGAGGGGPVQPGYDPWDPSTYGGGGAGGGTGGNGMSDVIKRLMGGAGGGQGGGYPGMGGGGGGIGDMLGMIMALNSLFGGSSDIDPAKMNQLWQAGMETYNRGADPQNQLRNRTRDRVVDQTRAGQSARGIAMSPYAAAGEAEAAKNFNIDWQNQQLNRQKTGFDALALASGGYFNQANTDRNFGAGQNAAATNALLTGAGNMMQPGGWLNSLFGGSAGGNEQWAGDFSNMSGGTSSPAQDAFGSSGTSWQPQYDAAYGNYRAPGP